MTRKRARNYRIAQWTGVPRDPQPRKWKKSKTRKSSKPRKMPLPGKSPIVRAGEVSEGSDETKYGDFWAPDDETP